MLNEIIGKSYFAAPISVGYLNFLYHRIDIVFPVIQKFVYPW